MAIYQGGLGLDLRSFATATKPVPSLNHNIQSVPKALAENSLRQRPNWNSGHHCSSQSSLSFQPAALR
jgi:hypothetical protein